MRPEVLKHTHLPLVAKGIVSRREYKMLQYIYITSIKSEELIYPEPVASLYVTLMLSKTAAQYGLYMTRQPTTSEAIQIYGKNFKPFPPHLIKKEMVQRLFDFPTVAVV